MTVSIEPGNPATEIFKSAAAELGFQTHDCNSPDMIGKSMIKQYSHLLLSWRHDCPYSSVN